jgi:Ca-activated chloride channel family protein
MLINRSVQLAMMFLFSLAMTAACLSQEAVHVNVNLVNVAFSIHDDHGALVDDLTKDQVDVFEDAVPQKIAFFARSSDVPLTLGLIVDASGSQDHFTKQHQHDLEMFLKEVLGPKDRAFIVCFGNHLRLVSDFSPSSGELIDRLNSFQKGSRGFLEIGPKESRELGTAFYDSIYYSITEKLANESGRKALLIFSDGEDNSSSHDMMTAIEAAQEANVTLFSIRYTEREHGKLTARNKYGIRVMGRIAKETGGNEFDAEQTDPHNYFRLIGEELRHSYELAYYPTNAVRDDTFRKIVIRPKQSSFTVRCKTGYFSREVAVPAIQ